MILAALNDYYQRLVEDGSESISPLGYSQGKISYAILLNEDGGIVDVLDIRDTSGKKPVPRSLTIPQPPKRAVNISACFLWDKTSYVLGVSRDGESAKLRLASGESLVEKEKKKLESQLNRLAQVHNAFKIMHREELYDIDDLGIKAFLSFLDAWRPDDFYEIPEFARHGEVILDSNVVFRLNGEQRYLHERPAARSAWARLSGETASGNRTGICLVTGEEAPLARLHPAIKGVMGAQSAGASIVSFNLDSFASYGKKQGENAPISEQVAFAYATVLNHLLQRGSRQQLRIGDASVVFWAEAPDKREAEGAERLLASFFNPDDDDIRAITQLYDVLEQVRQGLPLRDLGAHLEDGTRIYVLGLSPNASRLSIRFWETQTLAMFAKRLARHFEDLRLEPSPWRTPPAIWRLLLATAPSRDGKSKSEDVPPQLAGELTRAILNGGRYPRSLLTTVIMRLRADGEITGTRVALCKGILARDSRLGNKYTNEGVPPVSLDPTNADPGYLLGRLFSTLENVQRAALGKQINATIRDRYYGAASATPASVFPVLLRNTQNHLSKLRKDKPGFAVNLEKEIGEIIGHLGSTFPKSLRVEAQGHFAIGYYHQTQARFARVEGQDAAAMDIDSEGETV